LSIQSVNKKRTATIWDGFKDLEHDAISTDAEVAATFRKGNEEVDYMASQALVHLDAAVKIYYWRQARGSC